MWVGASSAWEVEGVGADGKGGEAHIARRGEGNRAWPHGKEDHARPYRKVGERVLRRGEDVSRRESARRVGEADGARERVRARRMDLGSRGERELTRAGRRGTRVGS